MNVSEMEVGEAEELERVCASIVDGDRDLEPNRLIIRYAPADNPEQEVVENVYYDPAISRKNGESRILVTCAQVLRLNESSKMLRRKLEFCRANLKRCQGELRKNMPENSNYLDDVASSEVQDFIHKSVSKLQCENDELKAYVFAESFDFQRTLKVLLKKVPASVLITAIVQLDLSGEVSAAQACNQFDASPPSFDLQALYAHISAATSNKDQCVAHGVEPEANTAIEQERDSLRLELEALKKRHTRLLVALDRHASKSTANPARPMEDAKPSGDRSPIAVELSSEQTAENRPLEPIAEEHHVRTSGCNQPLGPLAQDLMPSSVKAITKKSLEQPEEAQDLMPSSVKAITKRSLDQTGEAQDLQSSKPITKISLEQTGEAQDLQSSKPITENLSADPFAEEAKQDCVDSAQETAATKREWEACPIPESEQYLRRILELQEEVQHLKEASRDHWQTFPAMYPKRLEKAISESGNLSRLHFLHHDHRAREQLNRMSTHIAKTEQETKLLQSLKRIPEVSESTKVRANATTDLNPDRTLNHALLQCNFRAIEFDRQWQGLKDEFTTTKDLIETTVLQHKRLIDQEIEMLETSTASDLEIVQYRAQLLRVQDHLEQSHKFGADLETEILTCIHPSDELLQVMKNDEAWDSFSKSFSGRTLLLEQHCSLLSKLEMLRAQKDDLKLQKATLKEQKADLEHDMAKLAFSMTRRAVSTPSTVAHSGISSGVMSRQSQRFGTPQACKHECDEPEFAFDIHRSLHQETAPLHSSKMDSRGKLDFGFRPNGECEESLENSTLLKVTKSHALRDSGREKKVSQRARRRLDHIPQKRKIISQRQGTLSFGSYMKSVKSDKNALAKLQVVQSLPHL